jgi:hypothetical protein
MWVREQEFREKRERRYALARQKLLEAEMALCDSTRTSSSSAREGSTVPSLPELVRSRVPIADRPKWVGGVLATVGSYA